MTDTVHTPPLTDAELEKLDAKEIAKMAYKEVSLLYKKYYAFKESSVKEIDRLREEVHALRGKAPENKGTF
ncbi:unnamed protein product [Vitrella brassicaformis CCMP3155]|uniref:Uncharacterized protein n=1 Tax=Vitrella brassicaformis (strain CCMP3155) TaxID=1169540 RepID=A0A0G4F0M5_VITBC|nr:unnamed protein product [Vitrella brassicaformis CCMP3155]|eukprot:CEM05278.1 unnamed protein product [Vitrella brassicaformis CCMP3155]